MEAELSDTEPLNTSTLKQTSRARGSVISQVKQKYDLFIISLQ